MCDVTAAVVGVTAVAGAAAASSSKKSAPVTTSTTSSPTSQAQAQEIGHGLLENRRVYEVGQELDPYSGPVTATQDPRVQQALEGGADYAAGAGGALADQASQSAGVLMSATPGYVDRATQMATNGTGPMNATTQGVLTQAANGQPLAAPNATGMAGEAALGTGVANAQGLVQQAAGDPAQRALATAGDYANSDVVQQQIDNAALDVTRNFSEVTAPSLNARASAGGNLNSARAGIAEGLARRDAGESIGRIASDMRGTAFNTGVQASLTGNSQNNSLALGANNQVLSGGQTQATLGETQRQHTADAALTGATTLGQQDLANRTLDANTRLEANAQTGAAARSGFDAAQSAGALVDANTAREAGAGLNATANDQAALDAAQEQYYRDYNTQRGLLSDFMGVAGQRIDTGASTTTNVGATPQQPNVIQGAIGGAAQGAALAPYVQSAWNRANTPSVGAPKNF